MKLIKRLHSKEGNGHACLISESRQDTERLIEALKEGGYDPDIVESLTESLSKGL